MSLLNVLIYPDPLLRQKTSKVTQFNERLSRLTDDMFETMHNHAGVGLAGPQVGILEQILVYQFKSKKNVLINPKIISKEGKVSGEEGCLSIPDVRLMVDRAKSIVITYQTLTGEKRTLEESGFVARIIQHEIDHLHGVLITDLSIHPAP